MASLGLTLPWELKISRRAVQGGPPVEPSETEAAENRPAGARAEDAALAAGCLGGDMRAYEKLFRLEGPRMKNLARHLLGSESDAEDAVQDTFLKIQRGIASFRGQSSFLTWTFRILVNTCHDMRRSRRRRKEQGSNDPEDLPRAAEPRAPGAHPSLRLALERAVAQLTSHQRDVFLLYEVEGFRHAEIATLLEITETSSKNTLFQAKKNLRSMLEPPRSAEAGGAR